jgi:anti-sigma regulatory factor (Ser/Thr protein kinase)
MGTRNAWSYDLDLPGQPESVSRARDFVRQRLLAHGLAHLVDDVMLVVSELAANAVKYAQTPFKVSLQSVEQALLLKVVDGSPRGLVHVPAQVLDISGRGLTIVALLNHDWGVDAQAGGGKSVWAKFNQL